MTDKIEINVLTGEIKNVSYSAEEIAQREQDAIQAERDRLTREQELAQQESKKQSAITKLKALGLDEEEVKAIIGI
jgi:hypothetical protein